MYKVRVAKTDFTGTCGHTVASGDRFVVIEPQPQFHCQKCGKHGITKAYKEELDDLSGRAKAKAEAEEERP